MSANLQHTTIAVILAFPMFNQIQFNTLFSLGQVSEARNKAQKMVTMQALLNSNLCSVLLEVDL